jgi:hypothetical protein
MRAKLMMTSQDLDLHMACFCHLAQAQDSNCPISGRGDRIRTCDPLVPNQMRYQTALLPERRGYSAERVLDASLEGRGTETLTPPAWSLKHRVGDFLARREAQLARLPSANFQHADDWPLRRDKLAR